MLDLKFVRENPDIVKQNIKNKFQDRKLPLVDEVIELDAKARAVKTEADELRANRNRHNNVLSCEIHTYFPFRFCIVFIVFVFNFSFLNL